MQRWLWTDLGPRRDDADGVRGKGSRDLGQSLRQLRLARGLKQTVVAERIGRSEHWLIDVEGGRVDPRYADLLALADVYRVSVNELLPVPASQRRVTGVAAAGKLDPEEDEAKRRTFLAFLAAAGSGLVDAERLIVSVVDPAYLHDAAALTNAFLGQWYSATPSLLLAPVLAHLRGLQRALPGPPELENLTGRTALLAGYLFSKVGQAGEARLFFALAEDLARDTHDSNLRAVTLVARSGLHTWRITEDTSRSRALVSEAAQAMGTGAPQLLQTAVLARRAEERAALGDEDGFQRDIAAAEAALRPGADHWYGPRDAAELAAVRGASELLLGHHRDAADTLSWTLDRMNPSAVNWRAVVAADRDRALAAG